MAATFFKADCLEIGDSLVEEERVQFASDFKRTAKEKGSNLLLPVDVVVADDFSATASHRTVGVTDIPTGWRVMDIGPQTISLFENALNASKTVVWNGPMGVFETPPFDRGTTAIAVALADATGFHERLLYSFEKSPLR